MTKSKQTSVLSLQWLVFQVIIHVTLFFDFTRFALKFFYLIVYLKVKNANVKDVSKTYHDSNPLVNFEKIDRFIPKWNCDSNNPVVVQLNAVLFNGNTDPFFCVKTVISYIHKTIKFMMILPEPSSLTIKNGRGTCFHMLTVSVALLRCAGIDARFHLLKVRNVNFFKNETVRLKDRDEIIPLIIRESPFEWALGFFDGQKWMTQRIFSPSEIGDLNEIGNALNNTSKSRNRKNDYKVIAASDYLPVILAYGFKALFILYPDLIRELNANFYKITSVNPETSKNRNEAPLIRMNTGEMNVDLSNIRDEVHINK